MLPWLVAIRAFVVRPVPAVRRPVALYQRVRSAAPIVGGVVTSSIAVLRSSRRRRWAPAYPRSIFIIDALLLTLALGGIRFSRRLCREFGRAGSGTPRADLRRRRRGRADRAGHEDRRPGTAYQPVGFVDDDPARSGCGFTACRCSARARSRRHRRATPAGRSADRDSQRRPRRSSVGRRGPRAVQGPDQDAAEPARHPRRQRRGQQIRTLAFEDLLARAPVGLDPRPLNRLIDGRRVLVTGAGGSIGRSCAGRSRGWSPRRW